VLPTLTLFVLESRRLTLTCMENATASAGHGIPQLVSGPQRVAARPTSQVIDVTSGDAVPPVPAPAARARTGSGTPRAPTDINDAKHIIDLLSRKWLLQVMAALADGPMRHNELQRRIGAGIHTTSLDRTLRLMEESSLVRRRVHPGMPPSVVYELTPTARTLIRSLARLVTWARQHRHLAGAAT
jgi:DNA-binding HxlR family transcriptional regulator